MFCATIWMGTLKVTYLGSRDYVWTFNGTIYVENQTYRKKVGIHFLSESGAWVDMDASYGQPLLTAGGNRVEEWWVKGTRTSYSPPPGSLRFAAYYYKDWDGDGHWDACDWDNNGGNDYFVPVIAGPPASP